MLEGFTEEELAVYAKECQEKYSKKECEIIKSVLTGGISTYKHLISELEKLNIQYESEMDDYTDNLPPDIIECVVESFKEDGANDKHLVLAVKDWFSYMDAAEKATNKLVYTNDKGQISDEYGVPLNTDGEHRAFEVIKGGKAED